MTDNNNQVSSASRSMVEKLLVRRTRDLTQPSCAIVCTEDGMAVASANNDSEASARHSALTSALFALSNSFCSELLGGPNQEVALSSPQGNGVIVEFSIDGKRFYLCLTTGKATNLATAIRLAKDTGRQLKELISLK